MRFRSYLEELIWISNTKYKAFSQELPWLNYLKAVTIKFLEALTRTAVCLLFHLAILPFLRHHQKEGCHMAKLALEDFDKSPDTMPRVRWESWVGEHSSHKG